MPRPIKGTKEYREWRKKLRDSGPRLPKMTEKEFAVVREREALLAADREYTLESKPSTYRRKSRRRA